MNKPGYSQSISRLFTHSPSGPYLKKKYLQSFDEFSQYPNDMSKSVSIFDIDDPSTFLYEDQQVTHRYSEISLTPPKLYNRKLVGKSQAIFRKLNQQLRKFSKELPILSVCSKSHLINLNLNPESTQLTPAQSIVQRRHTKKESSINCKRLESIKQKNTKWKNLEKSKSPTKQPQSLQMKKALVDLNHKLKRLNKQNKQGKYQYLKQPKPLHLPTLPDERKQPTSGPNNFKAIQIKISDFTNKHVINRSSNQLPNLRKSSKRLHTDLIRDKSSRDADKNLQNYLQEQLKKGNRNTHKIKPSQSTSIIK